MALLDNIQTFESENNNSNTENLIVSQNLNENKNTPSTSDYDDIHSDFKKTKQISVNKPTENELKNENEKTTSVQSDGILQDKIETLKSIGTKKNKHKIRKRITIADSDSENDMEINNLNEREGSEDSISFNEAEKQLGYKKSRKPMAMLESDSEDELVINDCDTNTTKHRNIRRNKIKFDESDSDLEDKDNKSVLDDEPGEPIGFNEAEKQLSNKKSRKTTSMLESDSEDELDINDCETNTTKHRNIRKKQIKFDESDSDLEDKDNKSVLDDKPVEPGAIYTINSDGKLVDENLKVKRSNWAALCDSESSGPENSDKEQKDNSDSEKDCNFDEIIKPIKYKKKKKSKNENESYEMTAKQAAKQREEIRSESQRMLRESNISLPYHRPKSFTLKDFLARRPKFAFPLAEKMPTSIAIKMSAQQLEVISKKLEERQKEVKEFYKSDSEEEDPDNNDVLLDSEKGEDEDLDKSLQKLDDKNETLKNGDNLDGVDKNFENFDQKDIEFEQSDANKINKCKINTADNLTDNNRLTEENENKNKEYSEGKKIKIISEYVIKDGVENNYPLIENILTEPIHLGNKSSNSDSFPIDSCTEELNIENKSIAKNLEDSSYNHKTNLVVEQSINNYEFNLDDIEDNSENVLNNDKETQRVIDKSDNLPIVGEKLCKKLENQFEFGEIDREIENFGNNCQLVLKEIVNDNNEPIVIENPKFKLDSLKSRLSNIKPRLSGDRNHLIDLDNVVKPNEVNKLMERFIQHTAKKVHHKDQVKLNIVSVEHGGEIHKETVAVSVDEEDLSIEEKPGARLQKLRNELQSQIAQRKSEIWQQKAVAKESNLLVKDPNDDEKSECGADDAILDDDEEEEMSESSEEDEEEEVGDVTKEEISKKKSIFVNDEVEENDEIKGYVKSDNDDDSYEEENDNDDDSDEGDKENDEVADHDKKNNDNEMLPISKPLRRIIQCFSDDSDEDEYFGIPGETVKKIAEKLIRSNEDTNNTQEDYIRPYQLQNHAIKTPIKSLSESSNSDLKFLTPVSFITGLQNLTNSASKVNVPSPLKETDWHTELEKKLHADSIITNSQAEAMRELFSETFSESQDVSEIRSENIKSNTKSSDISLDIPQSVPPNTQDILNICTGRFDEPSSSNPPSTQDILNICSGKFTGISQVSDSISNIPVIHKANKVNEDHDIISQLTNKEEMEAFKKKFDSPVLTHAEQVEEVVEGGGIIDSDEEVLEVKKKRNQKQLTFSDDELSNEEKSDLYGNIEEEDNDEVNYDSEENEVTYSVEKEKEPLKIADFFEDEAELSESEWGSADEDEKDLDDLEFEQGDKEKFDENQLKSDLERIHMRRLLDDDTREVKLLQEMLLDDGELHGTGRERQFKWKNMDSNFPMDDEKKDSDDENGIEDNESEEQWRKKRHEREMFLKEKNSQEMKDDDLLSGSEILKLGRNVIQKSISNSEEVKVSLEKPDMSCSPAIKRTFSLLRKRGSFLTRGDQVLERLAEFNKTTATVVAGKTIKNSKKFLFQTVAQETVTTTSFLNLKRKADDGTPKIIKKLRLTDTLSPAMERKKMHNKQIKTKLFGIS